MENFDWDAKVKEALDRTEFMAISTIGSDGSWTNPVQFGYSEKCDLYFMSMLDSKHVKNLIQDDRISAAIFKTERFADRDVLGLQLKGTAKQLTERADVEEACRCFYTKDSRGIDYKTKIDEKMGENAVWHLFKITPEELWCFDSRIFGEKRERVDLETLDLTL